MIYYNLESEYPGDITKHCGLTIDEVDGNFYQLEQMIHEYGASSCDFTQRFWALSGSKDNNTLQIDMLSESTCNLNGIVSNGTCSFGIETLKLFGISSQLYGTVFANEVMLPKNIINPSLNCIMLNVKLEKLDNGEIGIHVKTAEDSKDTIYIETIGRKVYLRYLYHNKTVINGAFHFGNSLVIEDFNPTVWRNEYVWYDDYIWMYK